MLLTPEEEQAFIERNKKYSVPQNDFLAAVAEMPRDQAVKILRLATATGLDPDEAAKYPPTAVIQNLIGASDFEDVGKIAPKTYSFLSDPLHMAIVREKQKILALADMENESYSWKLAKSVGYGILDLIRTLGRFGIQAPLETIGEGSKLREPVPWAKTAGKAVGEVLDKYLQGEEVRSDWGPNIPIVDRPLGQLGLDFASFLPQFAAQVAAYLLSGGTASMLFMGAQIAGGHYERQREEGVAPERALGTGLANAALQAPLERIGLASGIMSKIPAGTSRLFKAREIAKSTLAEAFTEAVQQYPESLTDIIAKHPEYNTQQVVEQFLNDFLQTTKEGLYAGLVAAPFGLIGGAVKVSLQKQANKNFINHLEQQQNILAKSGIVNLSPELAEKFGNELAEGDKIYIDPEALVLCQAQNPEAVEKLGVTPEEVTRAAQEGQFVEVPEGTYNAVAVQHPDMHQALKDDIAFDEEGYTLRRLEEKNVSDVKRTQEEVKRREREVKEASDAIYQNMLDAGVKPEVAKSALVALVKNAHVMSPDDPAGWLRTKAPLFRKGKAAEASGYFQYAGPDIRFSLSPDLSVSGLPDTITVDGVERQTRDSAGQPIYPTEEGIRNFWRWFGSSRVVDKQGRPLVVYHTTDATDITQFDLSKLGTNTEQNTDAKEASRMARLGFWFAARDVSDRSPFVRGVTYPVYLSISNPRVYKTFDSMWSDARRYASADKWRASLVARGFDGVIVKNDTELNTTSFVAFRPEQIKSATGNRGTFDPTNPKIFMQIFQGSPKGSIHWNEEGRAIITLFENADASTVIHEMVGHYFMQNLIEMGAKKDAPEWMKRDRKTILDWVGIADWDLASEEQKREAHEKLARAAEVYFMEGKAPSLETRGIFRRFKDWLLAVYKTVKNLGVNITPEIRAVFDRMLATEEEIAQVEMLGEYHQRLPQEVWDKLTDAQKDELERAILRAREQAENDLRARIMRFISADNQYTLAEEYAAAQKFISEELAKDPLYMARAAMMAPANKKEINKAIAARIEEKIEQYIEVLVRNSKLGVEKKTATQTEEGEWVFAAGFSRNHNWYRDMLAELGGKLPKAWSEYIDWVKDGKPVAEGEKPKRMPPKMYEKYREIAEKHLEKGYIDDFFGEIPPDDEYINLKQGTPGWEFVMNNGGGLKLNRALLMEEHPELADKIPRQMVVNEGGFSADLIAEIFGFTSGDELLRKIISEPPFGEAVKIKLKAHMRQFRDILENPEALRQEAQEAMYSDDGATLIALENQFIQEALGKIQTREEARKAAIQARESAKAVAREKMAAMPLEKAMKLHTYFAAERRAAEKAAKAMAKGDLAKAREYKEAQLISHTMFMESLRLRREFERITKYIKRQQKADRDTWKKEEHFVQAAEILRRFGYAHKQYDPNIRRETLQSWATRMNEETAAVSIADWLFDETYENMPKRMTIEQLKDVENALRNIKHLARQEDAFYTLFAQAKINAAVAEAEKRLANRKDVYIPEFGEEEAERKGNWRRGYLFSVRKFTQLVNELDGNKDFGFFYKLPYERAYQAANKLSDIMHGIQANLAKAYGLYSKKELRDMVNKKQYYPELGVSAKKMTIIQMALHTGSASNRHVLFGVPPIGLEKSSLWVEGKPQETEARVMEFLGRTLDARDWKFVQDIWDIIDSLWPQANAMHKQMTGYSMEKVEAKPFTETLADGSRINIKGGYFPLKEDSRSRLKSAQRSEAEQDPLYTERSFIWDLTTRTGYTHARTGAVYPVSLDASNIFRHLFDVAHDIAFRPVVTDLRRLVKNPDFERLMKRKLGPEGYNAILDFVAAAANSKTEAAGLGRGLEYLERTANILREHVVIAQLMLRLRPALQNLANPFLYGDQVDGFTYADARRAFFQRGVFGYWTPSGYRQMRDFVLSKSAFMRDKLETPDFILHELRDKVTGEQSKVVKFGTMLLAETDNLANIPMWLEAYHKKINEGATEHEAVRFADTLIDRTTGSGRKIDTALILRGNAVIRTLTMFQSFMNTQLNAWIREYKIFVAEKDVPRLLAFVASRWWLFVAASMWLGGDWPDEDKDGDKWLAKWVSEVLGYPLRLFPIVGEVAAIALDHVLGVKTFGYRMSPIQGIIEAGHRTVGTTIKWVKGDKETKDLLEAASTFGAFLVPYPDQFNDWFWNAYDILNEGMEPQFTDLIKRRPLEER